MLTRWHSSSWQFKNLMFLWVATGSNNMLLLLYWISSLWFAGALNWLKGRKRLFICLHLSLGPSSGTAIRSDSPYALAKPWILLLFVHSPLLQSRWPVSVCVIRGLVYAAVAEVWDYWCSRWCLRFRAVSGLLYITDQGCLRESFVGDVGDR